MGRVDAGEAVGFEDFVVEDADSGGGSGGDGGSVGSGSTAAVAATRPYTVVAHTTTRVIELQRHEAAYLTTHATGGVLMSHPRASLRALRKSASERTDLESSWVYTMLRNSHLLLQFSSDVVRELCTLAVSKQYERGDVGEC
jgi:hypothetical protein